MSESVTQLLGAWRSGDEAALEQLTPLVYNELRRLAGRYMQSERPGHTLQATAVVNEAFMRMSTWTCRGKTAPISSPSRRD